MPHTQSVNPETIEVLEECSRRSAAESITFPEVVQKLIAAGVEFYYADLYQHERTYHFPNGEIQYREFLRQIQAAGAATYSVYITGKRAIYTGRQGDSYTEWFPGAR
jgi:uncharacterized protein YbcV (DUF1398 family)